MMSTCKKLVEGQGLNKLSDIFHSHLEISQKEKSKE